MARNLALDYLAGTSRSVLLAAPVAGLAEGTAAILVTIGG
jgi:hypothetical protein